MAQQPVQPNAAVRFLRKITDFLDPVLIFLKEYAGVLIGLVVLIVFIVVAWNYFGGIISETTRTEEPTTSGQIILVTTVSLLFLLIVWFLVVFTGREVSNSELSRIITYCYVFTWAALVGSVLPFLALPVGGDVLLKIMTTSPIGIVKGCSQEPTSGKSSVPEELQCDKNTDQWLVNVGGRVVPNDEDRGQWAPVRVEGGLIVPLYFVVLALFGAAVSMTRRVPEYQERTGPGSSQPLSNGKAREYLVLQIMQVVSAPLIAVTAYYLIDPSSRASTVALGFVSGFASETILLYIRALTSKLQPEGAGETTEPEIEINPSSVDFGDQAIGSISTAQTVTLTNKTDRSLNIELIQVTRDFTQDNKCPVTVAGGTSWPINVQFSPGRKGVCKGVLAIIDDGAGSPRSVLLTGNGV